MPQGPIEPLPPGFANQVDEWLRSNEKTGLEVRWAAFPLGMVQRWIERAEIAEEALLDVHVEVDQLADFAADSMDLRVGETSIVARLNAICEQKKDWRIGKKDRKLIRDADSEGT